MQREALELKVWRDRKGDPLKEGRGQLAGYLKKLGLDRHVDHIVRDLLFPHILQESFLTRGGT